MMMTGTYAEDIHPFEAQTVPAEAAMIMSSLDAGEPTHEEKRVIRRVPYRTTTTLRLFRDLPGTPSLELHTRDINRRGLGFVTRHRLPLGYGGLVMLANEKGERVSVHCTLYRCREAAPGWYEGCICFSREQPQFDL